MERIVKQYDAGFVFEASNPMKLKEKIIQIQSSKEIVTTRVENAFSAVNKDLNWEQESQKLVELIKKYNG